MTSLQPRLLNQYRKCYSFISVIDIVSHNSCIIIQLFTVIGNHYLCDQGRAKAFSGKCHINTRSSERKVYFEHLHSLVVAMHANEIDDICPVTYRPSKQLPSSSFVGINNKRLDLGLYIMFLWLKSSVFRCQRSATLSVELHMNVNVSL